MPRINRRGIRRRGDIAELDADGEQRRHLLDGWDFFGDGFPDDRDSFAAAWAIHGPQLLEEFIGERPGHRPFAWWLLDHKEERPVVNRGHPNHRADPERFRQEAQRYHFGYLHTSTWLGGCGWFQEPETDYLRRLGLLTREEMRALGGTAA